MTRMYEVAQTALTRLSGDHHSIPPKIMAALEEIRTVGERSLQAIHVDHCLDGGCSIFHSFHAPCFTATTPATATAATLVSKESKYL